MTTDGRQPWSGSDLGLLRLIIVIAGGLVVLQSSQGFGPLKAGYLVTAALVGLVALRSVWRQRGRAMVQASRPWLLASAVLVALIALSLPVSLANGTPVVQWVRDGATYGLFASAPIFALDAAASGRRGAILAITVIIGLLGAVSYAIDWISIRNLAVLPFGQFLLPTSSLPTTLFVVSFGAAIVDRPRRAAWVALGALALSIFLVTGTRAALLFLVALPVVAIAAGRSLRPRAAATAVATCAATAVLVLCVQGAFVLASRELAPPIDVGGPLQSMIAGPPGASAVTVGSAGASPATTPATGPTPRPTANPDANLFQRIERFLTSPERDGSVRERVSQYQVAWSLFASSPIVGVGLGHPFVWTRVDGTIRDDFTADTPLVLPAKLGILGFVWLALVAVAWVRFVQRVRRSAGVTVAGLAMVGWATILVALAWSGFSIEDKGFSFALMLMLAIGLMEVERAAGRAS